MYTDVEDSVPSTTQHVSLRLHDKCSKGRLTVVNLDLDMTVPRDYFCRTSREDQVVRRVRRYDIIGTENKRSYIRLQNCRPPE